MTSIYPSQLEKLQQAIQTLELQRAVLGDVATDTSIEAIQKQIAELEKSEDELIQQRKLATILFTDIVGHTKLIQDLDPEDNMAIIDNALVRLAAVVEAHGGHVARYQGDGFKAIFGVPTAHESDPQKAVRAGLEIIVAAQEYGDQLEAEWKISGFNVRVGIDTGLVVAGGVTEAEDTIKGLVVNLAARLESAAPPGGLLISQHTYQHVRGVFEVEPLQPILAKGFPEPVPVYLVKAAKPRTFHLDARGVEGVETKTVGRETELAQLQSAYWTAVKQNQTTVVTLVGEAGVGKSRLLYEFEKWLDRQSDQIATFKGRASQQTQNIPHYLARDILAIRFQILDSDPLNIVQQKFVAGFVTYLPDEGEMKAHIVGARLGYDFGDSPHVQLLADNPEQIRNRALLYLTQFFNAISAESPIVILLEDLHWADRGSLDTLVDLVQQQPQLPMLVLCLARPSLYQHQPAWGENLPAHSRLDLAPLSVSDTRVLIIELLRLVDPLPPLLLDLVGSRAEGNPFYAEELVKMLIDEGTIVTGAEAWHVAVEQLHDLKVPDTLTGVLQARLDRLGSAEKQAVQQASVIGRIFWDNTLAALRNEGHLALPALEAKEFIFARARSTFAGTEEYIFKHALLRDVTYETVLRRLRRDYHARIAQWIEQNASERLGEFSGLIAEHYTLAEAFDLASVYWEKGGDLALNSGDFVSAQDAYKRALRLAPERDPLTLAELERKLAETLPPLQRFDEAEVAYRSALERLERQPPIVDYARWQSVRLNILLGLLDALYWQLRPQAMANLTEQTQALLDEVGTAKQQSDYYGRLAQMDFVQNQFRTSNDSTQRARKSLLHAQETGNIRLVARQQFHLGFHLLWLGCFEEASALLFRTQATAEELGDSWLEVQCLTYLSVVFRLQGDTNQMAILLPRLADVAQRIGNLNYLGLSQANSAWLHYRAEEWQQAQDQLEKALANWEGAVYPIKWPGHWLLLALALQQERPTDAVAAAYAMLDSKQQPPVETVAKVLGSAIAAWEENDEAEVQSHLEAAVELATQHGYL